MSCSIVIATYNKADILKQTLLSIFSQDAEFEVVVVNDGSDDHTDEVCSKFPLVYKYLDRPGYKNPSHARNIGYSLSKNDVIIAQSDDVVHIEKDTISKLEEALLPGTFVLGEVWNGTCGVSEDGVISDIKKTWLYVGKDYQRPFFFLGALYRKDLFAIGGNDEEFVEPGYDDDWFATCLILGLKLKPVYTTIQGLHQSHSRPSNSISVNSKMLFDSKLKSEKWYSHKTCL